MLNNTQNNECFHFQHEFFMICIALEHNELLHGN